MNVPRGACAAPATIENALNGITGTSRMPSSRVTPPASTIRSNRSKRSWPANRYRSGRAAWRPIQ